jgi:hypothetical protein
MWTRARLADGGVTARTTDRSNRRSLRPVASSFKLLFPRPSATHRREIAWLTEKSAFARCPRGRQFPPRESAARPDNDTCRFCTVLTGATGLEPATSGVTGRRSNQLNYAPASEAQSSRARSAVLAPGRRSRPPRGLAPLAAPGSPGPCLVALSPPAGHHQRRPDRPRSVSRSPSTPAGATA